MSNNIISDDDLLYMYRLKLLYRYNGRTKVSQENVAEHSFYVALIVLKLCTKFDIDESTRLKCLAKALLHDMPEIELNDITHDVKEKLKLRPLLKEYEDKFYVIHFPEYSELMTDDNDTNSKNILISKIVNLADCISVKQYILYEKSIGNTTLDELLNVTNSRINSIQNDIRRLNND